MLFPKKWRRSKKKKQRSTSRSTSTFMPRQCSIEQLESRRLLAAFKYVAGEVVGNAEIIAKQNSPFVDFHSSSPLSAVGTASNYFRTNIEQLPSSWSSTLGSNAYANVLFASGTSRENPIRDGSHELTFDTYAGTGGTLVGQSKSISSFINTSIPFIYELVGDHPNKQLGDRVRVGVDLEAIIGKFIFHADGSGWAYPDGPNSVTYNISYKIGDGDLQHWSGNVNGSDLPYPTYFSIAPGLFEVEAQIGDLIWISVDLASSATGANGIDGEIGGSVEIDLYMPSFVNLKIDEVEFNLNTQSLDFEYIIEHEDAQGGEKISLSWVTQKGTADNIYLHKCDNALLNNSVYTIEDKTMGTYAVSIPWNELSQPPADALGLLIEFDPEDTLDEFVESDNDGLAYSPGSKLFDFTDESTSRVDRLGINYVTPELGVDLESGFKLSFYSVADRDYQAMGYDLDDQDSFIKVLSDFGELIEDPLAINAPMQADSPIIVSPDTITNHGVFELENEAAYLANYPGSHRLLIDPEGTPLEAALMDPSIVAVVALADFGLGCDGPVQTIAPFYGFYHNGTNDTAVVRTSFGSDDQVTVSGQSVFVSQFGRSTPTVFSGDPNQILIITADGNDTIVATPGTTVPLYVKAGPGNDTLIGGDGDDLLLGSLGDDTIKGGKGNDILIGGFGEDALDGEDGDDVLLGDGFELTASGFDLLLDDFSNFPTTINLQVNLSPIAGAKDTILGGDGDDFIIGGDGGDTIDAGPGNALIFGDSFYVQTSVASSVEIDVSNLWTSPATILALLKVDIGLSGNGGDIITGGDKNNVILGGAGNDTIKGGNSSDQYDFLFGNDGDDTILGLDGFNFIVGGLGDEKLLQGGKDTDIILGDDFKLDTGPFNFSGLLDFNPSSAAAAIQKFANLAQIPDGDTSKETFLGLELIGDGMDTIKTGNGMNLVAGGGGRDTIIGGSGIVDVLYGNGGNDHIEGRDGIDFIVGGDGNDDIWGGAISSPDNFANILFGDNVVVDVEFDLTGLFEESPTMPGVSIDLYGNGWDHIHGGNAFDFIVGGNGQDTMWGGNGTNVVFGDDFSIVGTLFDFTSILVNPFDSIAVELSKLAAEKSLQAVKDFFWGVDGDDSDPYTNADDYYGGTGNDYVFGGDGNDYIEGDPPGYPDVSFDFLVGGFGDDDILLPGVGGTVVDWANLAWGGPGDDTITGGDGNDILGSTLGNDRFYGNYGNDAIFGGDGGDQFYGGDGDDYLRGEAGNDFLSGGLGNDDIFGGTGDDVIYGGPGNDILAGGSGANRLFEDRVAADADNDGDVDGADFLLWQRNYGKTVGVLVEDGDANADGGVDGEDLALWGSMFGEDSISKLFTLVTVTNDWDLINGDTSSIANLFASDGGDGISLREAILAANSQAGVDRIQFDTSLSGSRILLALGELEITESLIIDATNLTAGFTLDAQQNSRLFNISTTTGDFRIAGLTLTGGKTTGEFESGGAIRSLTTGSLTIDQSTLTGNSTTGNEADGGGISAHNLTLINSTVSGNSTWGSLADGGGIATSGYLTLSSSTVANNHTYANNSAGGGIWNDDDTVSISHSIVATNTSAGSNPDLYLGTGALIIDYSLIGDKDGTSLVESSIADANGNLIGSSSGDGSMDPRLAPLADNGGPTETHALLFGSPAIDGGDPNAVAGVDDVPLYDQRGTSYARVLDSTGGGNRIDIGAYERKSLLLVDTLADELDDDYSAGNFSLREAIFLANSQAGADSIYFAPGLSGGTLLLLAGELEITESLAINATNLAAGLTIDAQENSRILNISAITGDFSLAGLTLTGGKTTESYEGGGAIRSLTIGNLNIDKSTISGNSTSGTSSRGGGIDATSVTLTNSIVSGNSTSSLYAHGGGVSANNLILINSIITSNSTSGYYSLGGGIKADNVTLHFSSVSGNSTLGGYTYGGGIHAADNLTLYNSTVSSNSTSGDHAHGGGVHASNVTFINSTISGNNASGSYASGGGIYADYVILTNSTVSGNSTLGGGGGIYASVNLMLSHSTVTNNHAAYSGGGIAGGRFSFNIGAVTITHSIIAGNTAEYTASDFNSSFNTLSFAYSLLGDSTGTNLIEAHTPDVNGSLVGSSAGSGIIDPGFAPLADNGGPTETHALLFGSPAIDAGNPSDVAGTDGVPLYDQRGDNQGRVQNGRIDIGAFESNIVSITLVVDTLADVLDGDTSAGNFSLREAIMAANILDGPDTITFDASLDGSSIHLLLGELEITDALTVDATSLAAGLTIDAQENSRILNISAITGDFSLAGLTLTGGKTTESYEGGGAIRSLTYGNLHIDKSTISGNSTSGTSSPGGGIYAYSVTLTNSTVSGNSVLGAYSHGGGIYAYSVTLTSSTISGNNASGPLSYGGGVYGRSVTLTNSTITGNMATGKGGGIVGFDMVLINSTISGNSTSGSYSRGGGIYTYRLMLTNSTVSGNSTAGTGGGIYSSGKTTLSHSTVTNNHASYGGGIAINYDTLTISNSIIASNTVAIINPNLWLGTSVALTMAYSLLGDNAGTSLGEAQMADANGNLIGSSSGSGILNPLLSPLSDNGGPTKTHALLPGSPAIDAGDPSVVAGSGGVPLYDQRGSNQGRVNNGRLDIGAYEAALALSASIDNSGVINGVDFLTWQRKTDQATVSFIANQTSRLEVDRPIVSSPSSTLEIYHAVPLLTAVSETLSAELVDRVLEGDFINRFGVEPVSPNAFDDEVFGKLLDELLGESDSGLLLAKSY